MLARGLCVPEALPNLLRAEVCLLPELPAAVSFLEGGFGWLTGRPSQPPDQCFSTCSQTIRKRPIPGTQLLPPESESLGVRPESEHFVNSTSEPGLQ